MTCQKRPPLREVRVSVLSQPWPPPACQCQVASAFYKFQMGPRTYAGCSGLWKYLQVAPARPRPCSTSTNGTAPSRLRATPPLRTFAVDRTSARWRGPENQNQNQNQNRNIPIPHPTTPMAGGRHFDFVLGTGTRGPRRASRHDASPWACSFKSVDVSSQTRLQITAIAITHSSCICGVRNGPPRVVKLEGVWERTPAV